jgi:hypothetical protein
MVFVTFFFVCHNQPRVCLSLTYAMMPEVADKSAGTSTSSILKACRDLMLHRSSLQFAAAFDRLADILLELAAKEYAPRTVGSLLDARSALLRLRGEIANAFTDQLTLRLNGRKPCLVPTGPMNTGSELSLQSDDVLDEYMSARNVMRSIESSTLGDLPLLHQRMAFLKRMPGMRMDEDPFSPQSVVSAMLEAMQSVADTTPEMRLHWLRAMAGMGGMGYSDVYSDLNRYLTDAGVAKQQPRAPSRPPVGQPGGQRAAESGALSSYEETWAGVANVGDGFANGGYAQPGQPGQSASYGQHAQMQSHMSMQPDAVPLQQLAANLVSLVERLQHVVPGISGGPGATDPSLHSMVRNKEAMQISAALGFAANGAFRAPLVASADPKLLSSLTSLQMQSGQPDFFGGGVQDAPRTVLREVVPGYATGDISVLDATTTELVAMMFDFVLARRELRDEIKVLLGRLQIPMLKAAMVDRGFFSRKNHPGRQLLNRLADAGLGWSPDEGLDDPLFRKIQSVIDRIVQNFVDDLGVFTEALVDLEQFVNGQELDARPAIDAETAEALEADRLISAVMEAKHTVESRISQHALPEQVKEFIEVAWQPHLQDSLLDKGKESGEYAKAVEALDELIWSVAPKDQPAERAQLGQRVPSLVKRLREGLKSLSNEAIAPFFDRLFEVHSGLLRGNQPDYVEPTELPDASNDTPFDPFNELVKQMERNQWIEIIDEKGAVTYAKLAWMSPQGTTYLFTTRHGRKAASLAPDELAEWFRTDKARMIESEPIVDRALAGMFKGTAAAEAVETAETGQTAKAA